jgi:RimJ/RimL family protein N-acetyltransferase
MPSAGVLPTEIRTERLLLRPWRAEDAADLKPVLEANRDHLGPWIPARVATPAPVPVLAERLSGFAADFTADREWRFGMFLLVDGGLLGEVALFPRSLAGRVPFEQADKVELGYWLRRDETGRGLVTEASKTLLALASTIPRFSRVEIRCDARNAPSAAIPQRLGFTLDPDPADADNMQVWVNSL